MSLGSLTLQYIIAEQRKNMLRRQARVKEGKIYSPFANSTVSWFAKLNVVWRRHYTYSLINCSLVIRAQIFLLSRFVIFRICQRIQYIEHLWQLLLLL